MPASETISAVVVQHAEEVAFLWMFRPRILTAPHCLLQDLAKLDNRIEAHLDGLRIAGGEGWKICEEKLATKEVGAVFTAGVKACESADTALVAKVVSIVEQEPKVADGLVSALGWPPFDQVQGHIHTLLESNKPVHQLIGIGAAAIHRHNPGVILANAVMSDEPLLKARALRAVGELGRLDLLGKLRTCLVTENETVRFWAAWSAALLSGDTQAIDALKTCSEGVGVHSAKAMQMVVGRLPLAAVKAWQETLSHNPVQCRQAIIAAGVIGDPAFIPGLIEQMKVPPLARLAGESFTTITGGDLAHCNLERKAPEVFNAGPTEDPKDENVKMDPDNNLPWPEPTLVQKWWDKNRGQFQSATRHLLGKPMSVEWLKTVLRDGRQRQRAAAAVELAIRQPGQTLFNVAAPGFRQQQILGKGEVIR